MKKGLTMTLLTVAIAMIGYQAMAAAPTISNIPSPIVGDKGDVTAPNTFVYSDAINLDSYVSDDTSPTAKILWSYEAASGSKYILNGIDPINSQDASGIEYNPAGKNIAANVATGEFNPDHNPRTVTIRNKELSPLGGQTSVPSGTPTGIVPTQTSTITLTASDGSSYSQKDLVIFTDNGGQDRLSGEEPQGPGEVVYHPTVTGTDKGGFVSAPQAGTVTFSNSSTNGICMETAAMNDNMGMWVGKAGDVPIAANSIYDIALTMVSNNASPGVAPFWDMMLDNQNNTGTGLNLYGADCYFLGNEGGANSATTTAKTFHMVWAPLAVGTAQFNDATTGAFRSAVGDQIKGRFNFRVMDIWLNGKSGIRADIQFGSICLKDLLMTKYPLANVKAVAGTAPYDKSTFTYTGSNVDLVSTTLTPNATTVSTTGGGITLTPFTGKVGTVDVDGKNTMYTSLFPGDAINDAPANQADNYPVALEANTIYRLSYTIAATDANSAANPPDCFYINADSPSNEVIFQNFVTSNAGGCAMPKQAASTYVSFYHSNFGTNTAEANWKRFRPSFIVANLPTLGGGGNNNSGSIKISNIKVEKVTINK